MLYPMWFSESPTNEMGGPFFRGPLRAESSIVPWDLHDRGVADPAFIWLPKFTTYM
jgi:hypothetical protein